MGSNSYWLELEGTHTQIQKLKIKRKKKKRREVACKIKAKQNTIGMFIGSFAVPTQVEERHCKLLSCSTSEAHREGQCSLQWRAWCSSHCEKQPTLKTSSFRSVKLFLSNAETTSCMDFSQKSVYVSVTSSSSETSTWLYCLQAFKLHFLRTAPSCFPGPTSYV